MRGMFRGLDPTYEALVVDPPWAFSSNSAAKPGRNARRHYATMKVAEIAALPVGELAAENCWLFLWITGPHLAVASHLTVLKAWGFKVSTLCFTWMKLRRGLDDHQLRLLPHAEGDMHFGGGLTTRKSCEFVLLGRRGRPQRASKSVREAILSPVLKEHSRKPAEFKRRVDAFTGGVKTAELFSRESWHGINRPWDCWGLEAGKFG